MTLRNRKATMPTEIHLYDFDSTLFRSPMSPMIWEGDWWNDLHSLIPPCVPQRPKADWWIGSTVREARKSIARPDVLAIMCTGRNSNPGFRFRIAELLKQVGLNFDEIHLSTTGSSLKDKKQVLARALWRYPTIQSVQIWDDRTNHLKEFQTMLVREGISPTNITLHPVRVQSKLPLCEQSPTILDPPRKITYLGIFLDAASRNQIVSDFGYTHGKTQNEHVTLTYTVSEGILSLVGQVIQMKVIGYAEDDKAQAVVVTLPSNLLSLLDDRVPHVTISHSSGVPPKYSNEMLKNGYERIHGPTLRGIIDTYPKSLKRMATR